MRQAERITKKIIFKLVNGEYKLATDAAATIIACQELMEQFDLPPGRQEVPFVEVSSGGLGDDKAPTYLLDLAAVVARAFCCKVAAYQTWRQRYASVVLFVGLNTSSTIALRAYEQLRDQLILSRARYISTLPAVVRGGYTQKEKHGDDWATSWVYQLSSLVSDCQANVDTSLIDEWLKRNLAKLVGTGCVIDFHGSDNPEPMLNCPPAVFDPCGCKDIDWPKEPKSPVLRTGVFAGAFATVSHDSVTRPAV